MSMIIFTCIFFLVNFKDIKRILHKEFLNKYKILKYKPKPLRQAVWYKVYIFILASCSFAITDVYTDKYPSIARYDFH